METDCTMPPRAANGTRREYSSGTFPAVRGQAQPAGADQSCQMRWKQNNRANLNPAVLISRERQPTVRQPTCVSVLHSAEVEMKTGALLALLVVGGAIFYFSGGAASLGLVPPADLPETITPPNATFIGTEQANPF